MSICGYIMPKGWPLAKEAHNLGCKMEILYPFRNEQLITCKTDGQKTLPFLYYCKIYHFYSECDLVVSGRVV